MRLSTFAFLHPLAPEQLEIFRHSLPKVEFIVATDGSLPPGIERADGVALSWNGPPIDDVLTAAKRMVWLHQRGAGIDRIATPRLVASKVVLTNGSGNHAINIGEHVIAMMLAFARQLPGLVRSQAERRWQPPDATSLFELSGQTLAVIGAGTLGFAVAERASAFGMQVRGVRRSAVGPELPRHFSSMVSIDSIDEALRDADHVAVTLPLTHETRNLFSTERLAAMKRGAYLYNVGRGAIVDQSALLAALRSGQLAGAGLDVTDPEPLPASSELWLEPRVMITAHSSGFTPHSYERYEALLLENLRRFDQGQPMLNIVDKSRGY